MVLLALLLGAGSLVLDIPAEAAGPDDEEAVGAYQERLDSDDPSRLVEHDLQTVGPLDTPEWPDAGVSAATVFPPDNRTLVSDTTQFGWRTVALLLLYDEFNTPIGDCSGVLLGGNVVLTAAHCLYSAGEWVGSVVVAPGATSAGPTFGTSRAYRMVVPNGWAGGVGKLGDDEPHEPSPFDYGLVFLEGNPFGKLGPFLVIASAPNSYFQYVPTVATAGFPGDRAFGSMWTASSDEFFVDDTYLYTRLDIWFGQSGSPIWSIGDQGVGFIFSVVSGGNASANRSVRFTSQTVSRMVEACQQNGCTISTEDFGTYALASGKLCRTSPTCSSGNEPLREGQPVRLAFSLSKLAVEPVRADFFWNGSFAFAETWAPPPPPGTGTFYITDPGLPPPPGPGVIRVDIWVGSIKAGSFEATVEAAASPTPTATKQPSPTPTVKPAPTASPTLQFRLRTQQLARD